MYFRGQAAEILKFAFPDDDFSFYVLKQQFSFLGEMVIMSCTNLLSGV